MIAGRAAHHDAPTVQECPSMRRVFGGAALVIAGIAAFIEARSNKPVPAETAPPAEGNVYEPPGPAFHGHGPTGLSHTAYDLLRIGA